MTKGQRAMAAAKIANMTVGRPWEKVIVGAPTIKNGDDDQATERLISQAEAAAMFGVSRDTAPAD